MSKNGASVVVLAIGCVVSACGNVDQKKFDPVYRAGKALEIEVNATGGASARSNELAKQFQTEVSALSGRARGTRETQALQAYAEAGDAYEFFIRFRSLDFDSVKGRIWLRGTNLDVASRFKFPVETKDGEKFVDSGDAMKILLEVAQRKLTEGNQIVNG